MLKYEKWSLGYWFVKQYITFVDRLIHRKIIVTGKNKIPKNKPLVFTPNHQNALSDPMAVLLNTRFQPVWLARADIFKKGIVTTILRFLKIMPVYRMRDGIENLPKNEKTFSDSVKVLQHNFALALFPEAAHSGKRKMLPHKKAVPRIVWMAEEKTDFSLDIQIIPTGIYYSHYWKFNRDLIINFGKPIRVLDFLENYKENVASATLALRDKIRESILPLIININSKTYYETFEEIRKIYGKYYLKRQQKRFDTLALFKSDQILCNHLDRLEDNKPEETNKLIPALNEYNAMLKRFKLRTWLVENTKLNLFLIPVQKLILLLSFPVFIFGFIFNAIPFSVITIITSKKIRDETFWSSFFLGLGLVVFPLFYVFEFLAVSWLIPYWWLKILFLLSLPFAGKIAFSWIILFKKTLGRIRLLFLKVFKQKEYRKLLRKKEQLFQKLDSLIPIS